MFSKCCLNFKKAKLALVAAVSITSSMLLQPNQALAYPILGVSYEAIGGAGLFDAYKNYQVGQLLEGSSYTFDADGIFRLSLVTTAGSAYVEMGFDLGSFGSGDIALKPATGQYLQRVKDHMNNTNAYSRDTDVNMDGVNSAMDALLLVNDLNANSTSGDYKRIGSANVSGGPTFIATAMNGLFRADKTFTIWNGQYNLSGLLGATDWWLSSGNPISLPSDSVPEPFTLALLGSGLAGLVARKKPTKSLN